MRIGIDARMYGPRQAGLGRYVEQLITHLSQIDDLNEYVIFLRHENIDKLKIKNLKLKIVEADIPWYSFREQLEFKSIIKKEKLDLMHFPHWNVPLLFNDPFVVTVHDLIMYHYPRQEASTRGPLLYWLKDKAHRLVIKHAVQKARHIIAPSEFTKRDLCETLGVPLQKISVIYLAPVEHGTQIEAQVDSPRSPYALYVGNAYPHKNLERLLEAWKIIEHKFGSSKCRLILAGKKNFFYDRLIAKARDDSNSVVFTDFLPDDQLAQLYSNATLYVCPSLYEGFGMPPLEAMTYGVPVAVANASCLPEILQDAAIYFNPQSAAEMAEVIYRGLSDAHLRAHLKNKAINLLKKYSWQEAARKTMAVYLSHT